jgi:hypothetical protein
MNTSKNCRFKKLLVFIAIFLLHSIVVPRMTIAASSDAMASIKPGPLTLETPSELTKFTLNEDKSTAIGIERLLLYWLY